MVVRLLLEITAELELREQRNDAASLRDADEPTLATDRTRSSRPLPCFGSATQSSPQSSRGFDPIGCMISIRASQCLQMYS